MTATPATETVESYPSTRFFLRDDPAYRAFTELLGAGGSGRGEAVLALRVPGAAASETAAAAERRLRGLVAEISAWAALPYVQNLEFLAVHAVLDGGVATDWSAALGGAVRQHLWVNPDAPWTVEGTPDDVGDRGFGTVTYRCPGPDDGRRAQAAGAGVDLVFGGPDRNVLALEAELAELLRWRPPRITYRAMPLYPARSLSSPYCPPPHWRWLPPEDLRIELTRYVRARLTQAGYHQITDQDFGLEPVLPAHTRLLLGGGYGDHRAQTLAVGPGARGYLGGISYRNLSGPHTWTAVMQPREAGGWRPVPVHQVSERLADPARRGVVFFPRFLHLDRLWMPADPDLRAAVEGLVDRGLAEHNERFVSLTEQGKDRVPEITSELIRAGGSRAARPQALR